APARPRALPREPQRPPRLQVGPGDLPQAPPSLSRSFRELPSQTRCCIHFARLLSMQTMAPPEDAATERSARLDERTAVIHRRVTETAKETDRRIIEGREETNHRF